MNITKALRARARRRRLDKFERSIQSPISSMIFSLTIYGKAAGLTEWEVIAYAREHFGPRIALGLKTRYTYMRKMDQQ